MKARLQKKKQRRLAEARARSTVSRRIVQTEPWRSSVFVHVPGDTPLDLIPPWITALVVQVAWGTGPPEQPIPSGWLDQARQRFTLYAWAWCDAVDIAEEARWHAEQARGYAGFCANMEDRYDAHGNSSDPRYAFPAFYLKNLNWPGKLAVTTTSEFGSDMTAWVKAGALVMPQAFPLEHPTATVTKCVQHAQAWGWPLSQIRPLVQSYPDPFGKRPDPAAMNTEATGLEVGVVPYTIEQAMDEPGRAWLEKMRPSITRGQTAPVEPPDGPTGPPPPEPVPPAAPELIGAQHGISALANNMRSVWPQWTKPNRDPNNLSTWGSIDKWERTQLMLVKDHDERASGT